jgi:adenylylsulfate kinase-like enzyme
VIILFCGIPGSGKSTIAGLLAERLAALGSVQILSSDKLRAPVYKKIFDALAPDRRTADLIILDATFFKKELERQVKTLAQAEKGITVYLDCPLQVALQRSRERQPNISAKAVHIVFHRMEPPNNPTVQIDTATTTPADAAAKIFEGVSTRRTPIRAIFARCWA